MEAIHFIQDLAVILVIAGIAGWVSHRLGLSTVVGYLVAGIIIGPYTPPFSLVTDIPRVETLAQLGLVFLMFSIGMRLSIRRLQRLGPGLLVAVACSAGLIFSLTRITGAVLGLGGVQTLFLAGMLMVSSSAIISKVLVEAGATHERSGQLAMGVSVLEDVVAVVMLTILNSIVQFGDTGQRVGMGATLGMLSAFVVSASIAGLLIVPQLLRRMSESAEEELQTLGLAGLLFGLALLAYKAGYSTALGAFLLGTIIAETPHRAQVDRIFEGMRDIFTAVFFVAIGLQIDPRVLLDSIVPIILLTVFTILVRVACSTIGLSISGTPLKDSLRTGLMVAPLGEFTFIIAQLGVSAKLIPTSYHPIAVGVSLLTALLAPVLTRGSESISLALLRLEPRWFSTLLSGYHGWLDRLALQQRRSLLWQLSRKRLLQVGLGMLFVTGLFLFGNRFSEEAMEWMGSDIFGPVAPEIVYWLGITLLALAPLYAIWRNLSAMAMLYAEMSVPEGSGGLRLRSLAEHGLRFLAASGLYVWLSSILPVEGVGKWMLFLMVALAVGGVFFAGRKLIYWHSEMELELQAILSPSRAGFSSAGVPWLQPHGEWDFAIIDCTLPDLADCRGVSLRHLGLRTRFGATIVGIERQGFSLSLPGPEVILYPRDKVLLMGSPEQVKAAVVFLLRVRVHEDEETPLEDIRMQTFCLIDDSPALGLTLGDLSPSTRFGVQVAGIARQGRHILNPAAIERLQLRDELLCLGNSTQLKQFRHWLLGGVSEIKKAPG